MSAKGSGPMATGRLLSPERKKADNTHSTNRKRLQRDCGDTIHTVGTQHIVEPQPDGRGGQVGLAWFRPVLSNSPRRWVWMRRGGTVVGVGLRDVLSVGTLSSQGGVGALSKGSSLLPGLEG